MRQIFFTGEEAQEWAALLRVVVANGPPQHGIAGFEAIEHGAQSCWGGYVEFDVAANLRQGPEVGREDDSNHDIKYLNE